MDSAHDGLGECLTVAVRESQGARWRSALLVAIVVLGAGCDSRPGTDFRVGAEFSEVHPLPSERYICLSQDYFLPRIEAGGEVWTYNGPIMWAEDFDGIGKMDPGTDIGTFVVRMSEIRLHAHYAEGDLSFEGKTIPFMYDGGNGSIRHLNC